VGLAGGGSPDIMAGYYGASTRTNAPVWPKYYPSGVAGGEATLRLWGSLDAQSSGSCANTRMYTRKLSPKVIESGQRHSKDAASVRGLKTEEAGGGAAPGGGGGKDPHRYLSQGSEGGRWNRGPHDPPTRSFTRGYPFIFFGPPRPSSGWLFWRTPGSYPRPF